jgi:DeoR/GlpR family transcriptional regulator of sugar metabolism
MSIYNREEKYIALLSERNHTVKELSEKLFISEPTVRRDIIILKKKDIINCKRGVISLKSNSPDKRIPLFIRDMEHNEEKKEIALKAISLIKDGFVIMIDASTTAYYLLPYLNQFKNILVITNGAKTALEAASMGIRTICTGGEITLESFSYVGTDAEDVLSRYNADIAFFSCRGLTEDGIATDNSILENSIRRIMIKNSKKSILLCDKSKLGKKYLNTLCNINEIDLFLTN